MCQLRVISFVRFPSFVILESLSCHAESEDEDEGCDCAEGAEGGDEGYALEDSAD